MATRTYWQIAASPSNRSYADVFLGAGVEGALEQAKGYAAALKCSADLLVTDGLRYRLYGRAEDYGEVAYANLARLKQSATDLFARLARP